MLDFQQYAVVYVIEIPVAVSCPAPNENCQRCKALAAGSHSGVDQWLQLHKH